MVIHVFAYYNVSFMLVFVISILCCAAILFYSLYMTSYILFMYVFDNLHIERSYYIK